MIFVTFVPLSGTFGLSLLEFRFPESRRGCKVMSAEKPPIRKRWRYFTRRHAFLAAIIVGVGALALILLVLFLFRLGFVDRYVANQIKNTFANYGIRAEINEFHASFRPTQSRCQSGTLRFTDRRENRKDLIVSWRLSKSKIRMH